MAHKDPEARRAYFKAWAERRKKHRAEVKAAWHEKNRERINQAKREWREQNPGWNQAADARRYAREKAATVGTIDLDAVMRKAEGMCGICHLSFGEESLQFDHIVPLSKGGAHSEDNLQAVHRRCNLKKGTTIAA